MFAEMVPHIVFAHRLNAKGGKLKTPGALNKTWHEDDDFWVWGLIFRTVHVVLPTDRNR